MNVITERELVEFVDTNGKVPFRAWLMGLKDTKTRARIDARLLRVRSGNFGDAKPVGGGVHELRVDHGPGYRIYFAHDGERLVVLLAGGSKKSQAADIRRAKEYWIEYQGSE